MNLQVTKKPGQLERKIDKLSYAPKLGSRPPPPPMLSVDLIEPIKGDTEGTLTTDPSPSPSRTLVRNPDSDYRSLTWALEYHTIIRFS